MNQQLRGVRSAEDFLGAGDPGAIEAMIEAASPSEAAIQPRSSPGGYGEAALVEAYRQWGFLSANLDPLRLMATSPVAELEATQYGVGPAVPLVGRMRAAYCGSIGWDFGHIRDGARRRWISAEAESRAAQQMTEAEQSACLTLLARTHAFEAGLARRLPGGKLFGIGGAETFNLAADTILAESVRLGVDEVVIGGMHRGRFNLIANVCGKPLTPLIAEIVGKPAVPEGLGVSSDVSYHLGYSGDREIAGSRLRISVSAHPSHLQLIPIITQGRARARQAARGEDGRRAILPLLLHTDASFAGQGLVAEMFQLSKLAPFDLGGTIHVVIDNQVGFTTDPEDARSAHLCTDIARLVEAPVIHVNGDDVAAVYRAALVAANWRATFASDIVVRLVCYRRPGHNEIDEPRFTQPGMYQAIDGMTPVHELYAAQVEGGAEIAADASARMDADLKAAFDASKSYAVNSADWFGGLWAAKQRGTVADMLAPVATGLPMAELQKLGRLITDIPTGFTPDPKVAKFLAERRLSFEVGRDITWAAAETLALASLTHAGIPVRFGGQDCLRGAFTQRHWQLHDAKTGARHLVLAPAAKDAGNLEVHNTPLIEHAILCFEYGVTMDDPRRLNIWEAQFGEFLNIAQPVFDQCIACGEDRWLRASGIVILLPHGLDGGGPDHSTGRPERLLAACAGANIQVVNASTPANYFHLLRRQMMRAFLKPLVILTPKALLRHKACVSALTDFAGASAVPGGDRRRPGQGRRARDPVLRQGRLSVVGRARPPQARGQSRYRPRRAIASAAGGGDRGGAGRAPVGETGVGGGGAGQHGPPHPPRSHARTHRRSSHHPRRPRRRRHAGERRQVLAGG